MKYGEQIGNPGYPEQKWELISLLNNSDFQKMRLYVLTTHVVSPQQGQKARNVQDINQVK